MDHAQYQRRLAELPNAPEAVFDDAEFSQRRQRVLAAMDAAGLDALLLTDPADLYYLSGYRTFEVSVHTAGVFSADGLVLQVPSIETGPAMMTARADRVLGYRWEGVAEVIEPLLDTLAPYPTIGVDGWSPTLRSALRQQLESRLGFNRLVEAGSVLDGVRIVKSDAELDCLKQSASITSAGLQAASAAVKAGALDSHIAAVGARALHDAGSEFMSMQPIVTTGVRSSVIHLNHERRVIEPNDAVFLEFGSSYLRYTAPMMRTLIAGRASDNMRRTADTCRSVFEALCAAMKPGATFDDAARAGQAALAPLTDEVFFSGVFGYAVGAQFPPSWVEGSGYIALGELKTFESSMVFHLPLCLRRPGAFGIGLSDTVVVTDQGAVPLTDNDWQLVESGA